MRRKIVSPGAQGTPGFHRSVRIDPDDSKYAKRAGKQRKAKVALLLANMNWNAYNNFGGRSNYIHPVCIYAETAVLFL